jgi:ketopantoate reductase
VSAGGVDERDAFERWARVLSSSETRAVHVSAIEEVAQVARARGIDLGADAVARALRWHESLAPLTRASMARDLDAGRRVELEVTVGNDRSPRPRARHRHAQSTR